MPLRVSLLELPATFGDVPGALARVDALLGSGPPADLVLLPETSLTGYVSPELEFDLRPFAEPLGGPTCSALAELARRHRCHLVGPLIEQEGEHFYNALVGVGPDGALWLHYRKRHPWFPETWATPGEQPYPLVELGGLKLTAALCFDGHFLAEEAAEQLSQADLLLFSSAWVDREDSRRPLLCSLARHFHTTVLNANWGPGHPHVYGQGGSLIINPSGQVVAEAARGVFRLDTELSPLATRSGALGA